MSPDTKTVHTTNYCCRPLTQKRLFLHNSQGIPNVEISTFCWRGFKCRRHLRRHFLTKNVGDIMSATLESCGMRATFFTIFGCKIWMIFGYKIFDGNSGGIRFGCKYRQKYMLEFCQNFGYNSSIAKFCFWARMAQNFNRNLPYFFFVLFI